MERLEQLRLVFRQPTQRVAHGGGEFRRLGCSTPVRRGKHVVRGSFQRRWPPLPEIADENVARDRRQPRKRLIRYTSAAPLANGAQPGLLSHVLGECAVPTAVARNVSIQRNNSVPIDRDDAVIEVAIFGHSRSFLLIDAGVAKNPRRSISGFGDAGLRGWGIPRSVP